MQLLLDDGDTSSEENCSPVLPVDLVSREMLSSLYSMGERSIDEKLKRVLNKKREQIKQIGKSKFGLNEERARLRLP
jgi:hypothetical protein